VEPFVRATFGSTTFAARQGRTDPGRTILVCEILGTRGQNFTYHAGLAPMWISSAWVAYALESGVHAHSEGNWPRVVHLALSVPRYLLGARKGARYTSGLAYGRYREPNKDDLQYSWSLAYTKSPCTILGLHLCLVKFEPGYIYIYIYIYHA